MCTFSEHIHIDIHIKGKSVGKCILFESKWVSPTEFENMSGIYSAKKWRKNIKYKREPIGDWLAKTQKDHSINPFQDSQNCQEAINPHHVQLDQTPGNENNPNNENSCPLLIESQDVQTQISTDNLLREVRMMGEMIDKMSTRIEALTQEVKDQEARHKNATKKLRKTVQEQNAKNLTVRG